MSRDIIKGVIIFKLWLLSHFVDVIGLIALNQNPVSSKSTAAQLYCSILFRWQFKIKFINLHGKVNVCCWIILIASAQNVILHIIGSSCFLNIDK